MARVEPPSEMPYRRGSGCELCGAHEPLHRVELNESSGSTVAGNYRCPRVAYICDAHREVEPHVYRPPHATPVPGTTFRAPQRETLW